LIIAGGARRFQSRLVRQCGDPMKKPGERLRPFNPLAGVFEFDRGFHECRAAEAVIGHLSHKEGWRVNLWQPRPSPQANPDFVVVLEDGRRVGIEVTEFIDPKYAEQMRVAKDRGHPIPLPREWDAPGIEGKVRADLEKKDQKRPTWGDRLDEYLVVVHTDESLIGSQPDVADAAFAQMAPVACSLVTRAFFVLLFVPKSAGPRPRIYKIPVQSRRSSAADPN
jgi:hypothetical protein